MLSAARTSQCARAVVPRNAPLLASQVTYAFAELGHQVINA